MYSGVQMLMLSLADLRRGGMSKDPAFEQLWHLVAKQQMTVHWQPQLSCSLFFFGGCFFQGRKSGLGWITHFIHSVYDDTKGSSLSICAPVLVRLLDHSATHLSDNLTDCCFHADCLPLYSIPHKNRLAFFTQGLLIHVGLSISMNSKWESINHHTTKSIKSKLTTSFTCCAF